MVDGGVTCSVFYGGSSYLSIRLYYWCNREHSLVDKKEASEVERIVFIIRVS